ncbi:condensation protein [Streptomyces sp. NPDC005865]|uniref:condensation protein n=1 Tax=Streptomyces sp. NPDC005865 TaxID=3155453 RepID=UPI0033C66A12
MTALEHPARRADGPGRPPARVPFPVVDEVSRHCLQEEEPETVHIEVHLPGTPDPDRLRAAFTEALRRHPRILMREARGAWYRRRYEWELTEAPDTEVVTFPPVTPDALKRARERALSEAPPLTASPPIRLEVIRTRAPSGEGSRGQPDPPDGGGAPQVPSTERGTGSRERGDGTAPEHGTAEHTPLDGPPGETASGGADGRTPTDETAAPEPAPTAGPTDHTAAHADSGGQTPARATAAPAPTPTPTPTPTNGTTDGLPSHPAPPDRPREVAAGCVLLLTINHTALDGPACLRVLATAAELYGGRDNSAAAPPSRGAVGGQAVAAEPVADVASGWAPPARVARGAPEPSPGNGMLVAELPVPRRPKGSPFTVNDQLMVATALMIAHWNREHGARPRPFRITMPVDDRPRDATMPIGNGTRLVEVPFGADELSEEDWTPALIHRLLRRTSDRTRALKALPRPQLGRGAALLTAPVLPVALRAAVTRGLRRAAAPWTSTTLLSNIGRVPYALDFGDAGRAHAVWFSAPARLPRGLTVTTASTAGRLHLVLRWSRTLLSHGDGARLRDLFEQYLHATERATEQATEHPTDHTEARETHGGRT